MHKFSVLVNKWTGDIEERYQNPNRDHRYDRSIYKHPKYKRPNHADARDSAVPIKKSSTTKPAEKTFKQTAKPNKMKEVKHRSTDEKAWIFTMSISQ